MRISDWSSDVCSSDLHGRGAEHHRGGGYRRRQMAEALAVHGSAAIEEGAEQHGDLRRRLLAEASQDIHADDERDAGDAEQRARQLQRRERLMARHQPRDEEHEERRGGVQPAGEPPADETGRAAGRESGWTTVYIL